MPTDTYCISKKKAKQQGDISIWTKTLKKFKEFIPLAGSTNFDA